LGKKRRKKKKRKVNRQASKGKRTCAPKPLAEKGEFFWRGDIFLGGGKRERRANFVIEKKGPKKGKDAGPSKKDPGTTTKERAGLSPAGKRKRILHRPLIRKGGELWREKEKTNERLKREGRASDQ